jgi:predicted Zn-dependent protease
LVAPAIDIESKTSSGVRDLALRYLGQGKTDTAERLLHELLALHPDDVQGMRLLALILQAQQKSDEAVAILQKAIGIAPGAAHVHADMGALLRSIARPQEAVVALHRALALDPSMSAAWRLLGDALVDAGDVGAAGDAYERYARTDRFREALAAAGDHLARREGAQAEQIFRGILKQEGKHVGALCGLSAVALMSGQPAQAERLLRNALRQSPHLPMVWRGLGQTLMETGKLEAAEQAMREALRVEPRSARNWVMLGTILSRRLRQTEALDAYEHALTLQPAQPARITMSKGHLLKTLGRRAECEAAYLACIAMEPQNGEYYWCLADLKTYRFDDAQIAGMQSALAAPRQDPQNSALLHFALGRAFEQRGEHARAFDHYAQANALRRRGVQYDAAAFEVKSQRIRAVFTRDFLQQRLAQPAAAPAAAQPDAARADAARPSGTPIFIVGLPRSGSTLVEQILASHSQVEGTMELPHILNLMYELDRMGGGTDAYPESAAGMPVERLAALGQRYLKETAALRSGKPFFIDKMPNNFRHLGFMRLLLPQALFIDARRHPMDACFSAFKQYFAEGQAFTYDLEDLGRYYRGYLAMMNHWKAVMPGQVLTVHYENLVQDTEAQVRRLLDFCGLPFEPATLRFHETRRPVRTASSEQVRQPIYDTGVGHWRHFAAQLAPLERALGPALTDFAN